MFSIVPNLGFVADSEQLAEGVHWIRPPIEAKGEFVQICLKVPRADAVMAFAQPALQAGKHQMTGGKTCLGDLSTTTYCDRNVLVTVIRKTAVAFPSISHDFGAGLYSAFHESVQRLATAVRNDLKSQAPSIAFTLQNLRFIFRLPMPNHDSYRDKHFVRSTPLTPCGPPDPRLIDLNIVMGAGLTDPLGIRMCHTSAEPLEHSEGGLISLKPKLVLKLLGTYTGGMAGKKVGRPEPDRQRHVRLLHNRPGCQGHVTVARPAAQDTWVSDEPVRLADRATLPTSKTLWPSETLKIVGTRGLIGEQPLKLPKGVHTENLIRAGMSNEIG